jgi:hypothetical protein
MPYFETGKPFVRGWFSATKRSFYDCTTPEALDRLVAQHGLTVLYQYMHRYADGAGGLNPAFLAGADRLAADRRILVDTTGRMLARLRDMHAVFVGTTSGRTTAWIFNANGHDVPDVQVRLPAGVTIRGSAPGIAQSDRFVHIARLPAESATRLTLTDRVRFVGPRVHGLDRAGRARVRAGLATVWLNAGHEWSAGGVGPRSCRLVGDRGYESDPPLSVPGQAYRSRLLAGQVGIIARELALRRRPISTERFLGAESKPLEDHANW